MNDDDIIKEAAGLAEGIRPERDLWPDIAAAIEAREAPVQKRWTPMLAQAAAVVLLVGSSSMITYIAVKDDAPGTVVAQPEMLFEEASFGGRTSLGPGFIDARDALEAELEAELVKVSPQAKADIEANLTLIKDAIQELNVALANDPENTVLQERLLRIYREELALLRRVSGLTRNVMLRNDI